jgi:acylphosphatase
VQGVGFRDWTVAQASGMGISGWVRNNRNGTVEIEAEGSPEDLEAFVKWCHAGPRGAWVSDCKWS